MSDHLPVILSLETNQTVETAKILTNSIKLINSHNIINEIYLDCPIKVINTKFHIYNSIGQIVYTNKIVEKITNINVSLLAKGIYYIKFENLKQDLKFIEL